MAKPLELIHKLELNEIYPDAIDELEERLKEYPDEVETSVRLGFNLWYVVVENTRMKMNLPTKEYSNRFMNLYNLYSQILLNNADFCWVFGQGINMFWYEFEGATEKLGEELIKRACILDDFYNKFWTEDNNEKIKDRFIGRGIFANYYIT